MSLERSSHDQPVGSTFTYHTQRRRPGPKGVSSCVSLGVGERSSADELGPLDHFLTARWRLYSERRAGLPAVETPPIAHWSPGVGVRIGFPRRLDVRR